VRHDRFATRLGRNGSRTPAGSAPVRPATPYGSYVGGFIGGRIIFLNGTSSSGKSALARALLDVLPPPFFHLSVDSFGAARSELRTAELDPVELAAVLRRTWAGFHRAVGGMAHAGNDVVMDYVLGESWRLLDCLDVLLPRPVFMVGVTCAPEELRRRERTRGDRPLSLAASQGRVHTLVNYDVTCDTTGRTPSQCAEQVLHAWEHWPGVGAFVKMHVNVGPAGKATSR